MRPPPLSLALLCCALACASPRDHAPAIRSLYPDAGDADTRNPVVVIHGILGARLVQASTGKVVWGAFTSEGVDPTTPAGARALALPLDLEPGAPFDREHADVYADGPLERLDIGVLFSVLSVKVYAEIIQTLGAGGYVDPVLVDRSAPRYAEEHYTCYTFFYDWRRDNVQNALLLGEYLDVRRRQIVRTATARAERLRAQGTPAALARAQRIEDWLARGIKFDVVAHSMGGLIARYYLQYGRHDLPADGSTPEITWEGAKDIDRLVLVGTPSFGSLHAFRELHEGTRLAFFLPRYAPALLATMPAIYQLLPRERHWPFIDENGAPRAVALYDVESWERHGWGAFAAESFAEGERLLGAGFTRATLRQCVRSNLRRAEHLARALDRVQDTACPARVSLFAADTEPTLARCRLVAGAGRLVPDFAASEATLAPGDQTVTRASALADDRTDPEQPLYARCPIAWDSVTFLADDHVGITHNPLFKNNLLFALLEQAPRRLRPSSSVALVPAGS